MGFSLMFLRIRDGEVADANRGALEKHLSSLGLRVQSDRASGTVVDGDLQPLQFDGFWSDLTLDPFDQEEPVTAYISHATLSEAECGFLYELCVAGGLMVVNPQGNPTYLIPDHNHREIDVPDLAEAVWVESAQELRFALSHGFEAFSDYRRRVIASLGDS